MSRVAVRCENVGPPQGNGAKAHFVNPNRLLEACRIVVSCLEKAFGRRIGSIDEFEPLQKRIIRCIERNRDNGRPLTRALLGGDQGIGSANAVYPSYPLSSTALSSIVLSVPMRDQPAHPYFKIKWFTPPQNIYFLRVQSL